MTSKSLKNHGTQTSPLLRLSFEIRLMIYEYLLCPSMQPLTTAGVSDANPLPNFHTYSSEDTTSDAYTLSVRTIDPWFGSQGPRSWRRRSTYHVRTDSFLRSTTPTTYRVWLSPYTGHLQYTVPSLLSLNRQIHAEASKVLYSTYHFSFHTSIEAAVPFLSDLTPEARRHVRYMSFTKKALPYTNEFDRAEWSSLCEYLAVNHETAHTRNPHVPGALGFSLESLHLNVITGKPDSSWDTITPMTAADFSTMARTSRESGAGDVFGGVDLEWAGQLLKIKGLKKVTVQALVERLTRPASKKQASWIAFSKGVNAGGFEEWFQRALTA